MSVILDLCIRQYRKQKKGIFLEYMMALDAKARNERKYAILWELWQ